MTHKLRLLVIVALLLFTCTALAAERPIAIEKSELKIHVGKAGAFSFAGHDHWVSAPISAGTLDDGRSPHVEFKVDARKMKVLEQKGTSAKDQAEVQSTMQAKVLESERYPEISFRSTSIQPTGEKQWKVTGDLTLHGKTHPVETTVRSENGVYSGRAKLRQTDFDISPISVGGVVKVKNELEIEFRINPKP